MTRASMLEPNLPSSMVSKDIDPIPEDDVIRPMHLLAHHDKAQWLGYIVSRDLMFKRINFNFFSGAVPSIGEWAKATYGPYSRPIESKEPDLSKLDDFAYRAKRRELRQAVIDEYDHHAFHSKGVNIDAQLILTYLDRKNLSSFLRFC